MFPFAVDLLFCRYPIYGLPYSATPSLPNLPPPLSLGLNSLVLNGRYFPRPLTGLCVVNSPLFPHARFFLFWVGSFSKSHWTPDSPCYIVPLWPPPPNYRSLCVVLGFILVCFRSSGVPNSFGPCDTDWFRAPSFLFAFCIASSFCVYCSVFFLYWFVVYPPCSPSPKGTL